MYGIAAVISVSALMFFRTTDSAAKIESEFKALGVLVATIQATFGMQNNYSGLTTAVARDLPNVPESSKGAAGKLRSVWSADGINVGATTKLGTNDAFYIEYKNVPSGDCVNFTTKLIGDHFQDIFIQGKAVDSVSTVSAQCNASPTVTMRFVK